MRKNRFAVYKAVFLCYAIFGKYKVDRHKLHKSAKIWEWENAKSIKQRKSFRRKREPL